MRKLLAQNVLIAAGYSVVGWLALMVAVPPGYAAPIFPPAGIAVAALLTFGRWVLPSIFVGSFLVNLLAGQNVGTESLTTAIFPALMASIGPPIQALLAMKCLRFLGNPPGHCFESSRNVLIFYCLVAPITSLLAPSLAVPQLVHAGVISANDALFSWWNWWIGDTLGVITATPLALALFGKPRSIWAPRLINVALPLIAALVLVGGVFMQVRQWEGRRLDIQFARDAEGIFGLVQRRLEVQEEILLALERFVRASTEVTAAEWHEFAGLWLDRYPGILNLAWAPRIGAAERRAFELELRRDKDHRHGIMDRTPEGALYSARPAPEYLPYHLIEPIRGNELVVGLNPLSLPAARSAIERSRDEAAPIATPSLALVQDGGTGNGVVIYQAVFHHDADASKRPLRGVVSSALRLTDALTSALADAPVTTLDVCLVDRTDSANPSPLAGPLTCVDDSRIKPLPSLSRETRFAGRVWQIRVQATESYRTANLSWAVWVTLAVGLSCAGMLGAFLLINSSRSRRTQELVAERTAELASATQRLRHQRAALAEAQRMARMGSWILADNQMVECSAELVRMMGLPAGQPLPLARFLLPLPPDDRDRLDSLVIEAQHQPLTEAIDCTLPTADGTPEVLHFQIESGYVDQALRVRGTVQNVTAARQAEAHIHFLARYDALTGLPNRTHWQEHARTVVADAQRHGDPVAVLFLDLDNFKTVNDSLGHPVGDRLLTAVVARFASCLRATDLLARLGGDEFVVLISRFHQREDVARVAAKLIDSLRRPVAIDMHELSVGVSIGIALYPDDGNDVDTLLKHADVAMYGAKQAGRNAYHFFEVHMNDVALERLQIDHALRRALERKELVLHYQPKLDLVKGRATGCEALVRWQHPERGMIPPAHFIPIAEDTGLILPIGEWVLTEACRQQAELARQGVDLSIAINISALQFRRPDFADRVKRILAQTGADPARIELEITESALMEPDEAMLERLAILREQGITLALDDFGTGYSSLAYLRRLPIQCLKIDRSFVQDLPGDPEDEAIATATLSLARDLGLRVVAEGVETAAQREYLADRGCHLIQGYLVARPMPIGDLIHWLAAFDAKPEPDSSRVG
ncbi:MAG: EAL domain-containing protein [Zoogloeaceae bacterium]|nr:EAL domain-containing protein [Zoogloeaceae bacterium]